MPRLLSWTVRVAVETRLSAASASWDRVTGRGAFTPMAKARAAGVAFGMAPCGESGRSASTIVLLTDPTPSNSTSTTSPGPTTPVPAGVPVRITSPRSNVMKRARSATSWSKGKISSSVPASWASSPFTSVRSLSEPASTSRAGAIGPIGVYPSWPFDSRFDPRSAQRRSCTPKSFAGAYQPIARCASSLLTSRASSPMITAISPSKPSSSAPCGAFDRARPRRSWKVASGSRKARRGSAPAAQRGCGS